MRPARESASRGAATAIRRASSSIQPTYCCNSRYRPNRLSGLIATLPGGGNAWSKRPCWDHCLALIVPRRMPPFSGELRRDFAAGVPHPPTPGVEPHTRLSEVAHDDHVRPLNCQRQAVKEGRAEPALIPRLARPADEDLRDTVLLGERRDGADYVGPLELERRAAEL